MTRPHDTLTVLSMTILACLLAASAAACGPKAGTQTPDGQKSEKVVFDVDLVVEREGETTTISPQELFNEASAALKRKEYESCARDFDILWKSLEGSDYYSPSLYNAGLCYERLEEWEAASERYLFMLDEEMSTSDGLDALFRLAETDANASNWIRVRASMQLVLARPELRHFDKLEARYRIGMAHVALNEYTEAERQFKAAIRENRRAGAARLPGGNYFVSGCHYGMALVYHMMFSELKFRLPEEQMRKDMETKKTLARQAYQHYVRTVRERNHYWSVLSGYMVGKLFEDFYYDILSAEVPDDLSDEEVEGYFLALRDELRPLLEQALAAYEKTSAVSERIGVDNEWVRRTQERMERLRAYMDDEETLRQEEAAIVQWSQQLSELEEERAERHEDQELMVPPPTPPLPVAKAAAPH